MENYLKIFELLDEGHPLLKKSKRVQNLSKRIMLFMIYFVLVQTLSLQFSKHVAELLGLFEPILFCVLIFISVRPLQFLRIKNQDIDQQILRDHFTVIKRLSHDFSLMELQYVKKVLISQCKEYKRGIKTFYKNLLVMLILGLILGWAHFHFDNEKYELYYSLFNNYFLMFCALCLVWLSNTLKETHFWSNLHLNMLKLAMIKMAIWKQRQTFSSHENLKVDPVTDL